MNVYFSCEFTGLNEHAQLISLGMIASNGSSYYMEFLDVPMYLIQEASKPIVLNDTYLYGSGATSRADAQFAGEADALRYDFIYKAVLRDVAKYELLIWFDSLLDVCPANERIQLVSYCSHYDTSLFLNLFGPLIPSYLNQVCYDILPDIINYRYNKSSADDKLSLADKVFAIYSNMTLDQLAQELECKPIDYTKDNSFKYAKLIKLIYEKLNMIS